MCYRTGSWLGVDETLTVLTYEGTEISEPTQLYLVHCPTHTHKHIYAKIKNKSVCKGWRDSSVSISHAGTRA